MERLDVPRSTFWPYDVFGYLLPGLSLLAAGAFGNDYIAARVGDRWQSGSVADLALVIGGAYVLGHIVAALSSWLIERVALRSVWGYPTHFMFGGTPRPADSALQRLRILVINAMSPGYTRPYSGAFVQAFDEIFAAALGSSHLNPPLDDHDRFWLAWEYISLRHAAAYRRATHFLELYGFSRNTSMAFLLCAFVPAVPGWKHPMSAGLWVALATLIGWLLLCNYVKLLRRMNDEVYRGFVVAARLTHLESKEAL